MNCQNIVNTLQAHSLWVCLLTRERLHRFVLPIPQPCLCPGACCFSLVQEEPFYPLEGSDICSFSIFLSWTSGSLAGWTRPASLPLCRNLSQSPASQGHVAKATLCSRAGKAGSANTLLIVQSCGKLGGKLLVLVGEFLPALPNGSLILWSHQDVFVQREPRES